MNIVLKFLIFTKEFYNNMKKTLIRIHWIFSDIGIDFLKIFKSIKGLPIFMLDFINF
jgi:hypothetical protein